MNTTTADRESQGLLAWQWQQYSGAHRDRRNLLVHALTVPVFLAGTCALLASPWAAPGAWKLAVAGAGSRFAMAELAGRCVAGDELTFTA